jgi:hypothetical protein
VRLSAQRRRHKFDSSNVHSIHEYIAFGNPLYSIYKPSWHVCAVMMQLPLLRE